MSRYLFVTLLVLMAACSEKEPAIDRWYTQSQVINGATVFKKNCAICHGEEAQGTVSDWTQEQADGSYPPPPLNGSAHAWHHSRPALKRTILQGSIPLGGTMPPFRDKLNDNEVDSVIAYFQSKWDDKTYSAWLKRNPPK